MFRLQIVVLQTTWTLFLDAHVCKIGKITNNAVDDKVFYTACQIVFDFLYKYSHNINVNLGSFNKIILSFLSLSLRLRLNVTFTETESERHNSTRRKDETAVLSLGMNCLGMTVIDTPLLCTI